MDLYFGKNGDYKSSHIRKYVVGYFLWSGCPSVQQNAKTFVV